jgi:hypothetical protein
MSLLLLINAYKILVAKSEGGKTTWKTLARARGEYQNES